MSVSDRTSSANSALLPAGVAGTPPSTMATTRPTHAPMVSVSSTRSLTSVTSTGTVVNKQRKSQRSSALQASDSGRGKGFLRRAKVMQLPPELEEIDLTKMKSYAFQDKIKELIQRNEIDIALLFCDKGMKSMKTTRIDLKKHEKLNWIDVRLMECHCHLFHKHYTGDDELLSHVYRIYTHVLDALMRESNKNASVKENAYYAQMECTSRIGMALALAKISSNPHEYSTSALEHIRHAVRIDRKNALAFAVYGYILDRCLDKYIEARQYLEYALHLDSECAIAHLWLAMLLSNFADEFEALHDEIEEMHHLRKQSDEETPATGEEDDDADVIVRQFSRHQRSLRSQKIKNQPEMAKSQMGNESNPFAEEVSQYIQERIDNAQKSAALKEVVEKHDGSIFNVVRQSVFQETAKEADVVISDDPLEHFQVSIQLQVNNSIFYSSFASFQMAHNNYEAAQAALQYAIELDPNNVIAMTNLAYIYALPKFERYEEAKILWETVLELSPHCYSTLFNLGKLYGFVFNDIKTSEAFFMRAIKGNKKNPHFNFFMALICQFYEGNANKARQYFTIAKQNFNRAESGDAISYMRAAVVCVKKRRYDVAKVILAKGHEIDPHNTLIIKLGKQVVQLEQQQKKKKRQSAKNVSEEQRKHFAKLRSTNIQKNIANSIIN